MRMCALELPVGLDAPCLALELRKQAQYTRPTRFRQRPKVRFTVEDAGKLRLLAFMHLDYVKSCRNRAEGVRGDGYASGERIFDCRNQIENKGDFGS